MTQPIETIDTETAIVYRPTGALAIHPQIKHMPMLGAESPEMEALVDSVREHGLEMQPIIICPGDYVMDGRHRLKAAHRLQLDVVPCIEQPESALYSIVIRSVLARRHLTKSASAYLLYPMIEAEYEELMEAAEDDQKAALKQFHRCTTELCNGERGATSMDKLAAKYGINREFLRVARSIHGQFEAHPELRSKYEPRILSGELSLGQASTGIGGELATAGKPRRPDSLDGIWRRAIGAFTDPRKWASWDNTPEEMRSVVASEIASGAEVWPPEVRAAVAKKIARLEIEEREVRA